MAEFIQPLELKKIILNLFAGNPDIFLAISLIVIMGMSAYFRMSVVAMFFMLGIFLLLFSGTVIQSPMVAIFSIIAGLIIGLLVNKITKR